MNQNKKWYSLFLVMLISISTVIQPLQAVASVTAMETMATETKVMNEEIDQTPAEGDQKETNESEELMTSDSSINIEETTQTSEVESVETNSELEETTVDSLTEETEEKKLKTSKLVEDREPIDIKTLLNGEKFLTDVLVKVTDQDGNELDYKNESVPLDALISLNYHYSIPEHLLKEKKLKAGDYYDITIPKGININSSTEGTLGRFGTYKVVDGKFRLTFNELVETLYNISGDVTYNESLDETINAGDNDIKIPLDGEEKTVSVKVKPTGGTSISKRSDIGPDKKSIQWEVSINTNLETLNNATVTDKMPEDLDLKGIKIYEQIINKDGTVKSVSDTPISEDLYTVSGDVITFKGQTNKSYKIVYDTVIKENKIPEHGGEPSFFNQAVLKNNDKEYEANASATLKFGKLIEKMGPSKDDRFAEQVYRWEVKYNYGNKDLPAGSYIIDTLLGAKQEYVKDTKIEGLKAVEVEVEDGSKVDYVVDYIGDNQMKISFPKGLDKPVTISYFSKLPFVIDDSNSDTKLKNGVKTDNGVEAEAGGGVQNNAMNKSSVVDYGNRKITWTVNVNIYQYQMVNWNLKDTMSEGLTFNKESLKIREAYGNELVLDTDYEFVSSDAKNFHVKFKKPLSEGTNKSYTITYTTDFDYRRNDLKNTATSIWTGTDGENHTQTATDKPNIKQEFVDDATKSGSYNAVSKEITWTIKSNYNLEKLNKATIIDEIPEDQVYVANSAHVYEATISDRGKITQGAVIDAPINLEGRKLIAKLPEGSNKAYILEFKTAIKGDHISKATYSNTATYTNGSYSKDVTNTVTVRHGGEIIHKEGTQTGNYVNWSIPINRSQSRIEDLVLVDEPSTNQILDEKSIVIYETAVDTRGNVKRLGTTLNRDTDYKLDLTTNNETGKQVLTITFLKVVDTAYVLEYRSLINTNKGVDDLTNTISYTGNSSGSIADSEKGKAKVITSGGSGSGVAAALRIVKIDKNKEVALEGAQFDLWAIDRYTGERLQVVRSGATNKDGELKFANLMPEADYILVETKAPEGYTVSPENASGIRIHLKDTGEINLYETRTIKNDIPRVTFKKVTAKNRALPGATFVIKNSSNEYYNGIDSDNKVKWVSSKDKAEELVSDSKGNVEVAGLVPGQYVIEETKAPEGYEKLETTIAFEVINDHGVIKLKEAIKPIKNKKIPEFVDIEINKIWEDADNQDGLRKEISVDLLADGKVIKTVSLNEGNKWTATVDELPKHRADDEDVKINYTVKEKAIEGYNSEVKESFTEAAAEKLGKYTFNVTNTHKVSVRNISATKVWSDTNNQDGKRKDSVTVQLYAGEEKVHDAVVLDKNNDWTTTWIDLAVNKSGEEIKYSVKEVDVPDGYTASVKEEPEESGKFVITNTHKPEVTDISGTKTWSDADNQDGIRPEKITVNLLAGNDVIDSKEISESENWKYTFTNLPVYEVGKVGQKITYTVQEESIADYTPSVDGYNITNSYTPGKTFVNVAKVWNDDNNRDNVRPENITIKLFKHTAKDNKKVDTGKFVTLNAENNWQGTFTDLDINQPVGEKIIYTVEEDKIVNNPKAKETSDMDKLYQSSIEEVKTSDKEVSDKSFKVINTREIDTTSVKGVKTWNDNNNRDNQRPESIDIYLLADGEVALDVNGKAIKPITVSGNNTVDTWSYEFNDVPKHRAVKAGDTIKEAQAIEYTVKEVIAKKYESAGYKADYQAMNVTNTREIDKTSVQGVKTWSDNNNRDNQRPESIQIYLLADGEAALDETGKKIDPITVSGNNTVDTWSYEFKDVPKHRAVKAGETIKEAQAIEYTVKEVISKKATKAGYEAKEDVMNVTNTRPIDKISLSGKKTWNDNNNRDNQRPESIEVHLLADGKPALDENGDEIEPITVSGNNTVDTWSYEFKDVPKHRAVKAGDTIKEAQAIEYTVKEIISEKATKAGYEAKEDVMNVTNTRPIDKVSLKGTKTWSDFNNQDGKRPGSIKIHLLADGQPALDENGKEIKPIKVKGSNTADTWSYEFKDLPKHRAVKAGDTIKEAQAIEYKVKEEVSKKLINEGYTIKEEAMNVTNTRPLDKVSFKGTKVWDDVNNQDGIRPETITVNLLADGEKVASQKVTGSRGFEEKDATWSYEFKDLPKHAKGKVGKEIKYTVTEDKVSNYKTKIKGSTITNSYTPQVTRIFVEKAWDDASDQDGKRPQDIAIQLYADGKALTGKKLTLSSANKWKASIKNLPVKFKGKDIKYSVKEISEAAEKVGYKAKIAYSVNKENKQNKDVLVTNSRAVELTSVSGKKTWNDANNQDGIRSEEVTINLLADGKKIASQKVNVKTDWTYHFTELPVYKVGKVGQKVIYTVEEEAVKGYEPTITDTADGFDVTNTHKVELTEIKGKKTWNDADNQDGIRPEKITLNLLANGKKIQSTIADEASAWQYEFTNLPVYEVGKVGQKVTYTVEEEAVSGYESTKEGNDFTNTHKVELTEIKGKKTWNDANNQDGIRPEKITLNLLANGKKIQSTTADEASAWQYEFTNLPVYEVGKVGQKVTYTVEEEAVSGYESAKEGNDFINTHKVELTEIKGKKTWNDADNQDGIRPNEVTINLYADNQQVASQKVNAKTDWTYSFTNQPVYKVGKVGQKVVYSIKEEAVTGYQPTITKTADGFDVENTHQPEVIEINVKKVWKDTNNKDGIRPETITVNLFADGEAVTDAKGNKVIATMKGSMKENEWSYEFKDLPKYQSGKEISYSVTEDKVDGYETKVDKFTITNTHTPKKPSEPGTPGTPSNPGSSNKPSTGSSNQTGSLPKTGEAETSALVNLGMAILLVLFGSNVWFTRKRKVD